MENDVNKKSNIGLIIVIVLLSILVIMLGYYFVSNEILNNKTGHVENGDVVSSDTESEKQEIEYKFDASKIVNKNSIYEYTLAAEGQYVYNGEYEKTSGGYKFCSTYGCQELVGEFTTVIGVVVFKGGPGMGDGYYFLLSKDGTLYYANESVSEDIVTGVITQVKDVVKLYIVDLLGDGEVSAGGATVVAQTKDGALYDIYSYVKMRP